MLFSVGNFGHSMAKTSSLTACWASNSRLLRQPFTKSILRWQKSYIRRPLTLLILKKRILCWMPTQALALLVCRWLTESSRSMESRSFLRLWKIVSETQSSTVSPMPAMFAPLQKKPSKLGWIRVSRRMSS